MTALPTDQWTAALEGMAAAINGQLAELDARQRAEPVEPDTTTPAGRPEELLAWMEQRLDLWDQRLNEAAGFAASVVKQLGERETALTRWHNHLVRWQELIQQKAVPTDKSTGSHSSG